jgi:hypothetical protein
MSSARTASIATRSASSARLCFRTVFRVARRIRRTCARSNRCPSQCSQKPIAFAASADPSNPSALRVSTQSLHRARDDVPRNPPHGPCEVFGSTTFVRAIRHQPASPSRERRFRVGAGPPRFPALELTGRLNPRCSWLRSARPDVVCAKHTRPRGPFFQTGSGGL